ncbi:MAG: hypothetical protein KDK27_03595, partial [Leptospiraceae bacterium]|nr:hypothetical protein [Leptospiraceae bacterium]
AKHFEADLYFPEKSANHRLILFVHGMSVHGNQDQRVINVCSAMSSAGFHVIAPLYPDIQNLQIHSGEVEDLAETIRALVVDQTLCRSGKLGLIAPSFSASIALKAAALTDIAPLVTSICTIGGYTDVDSTLSYLLGAQDIDEYGKWVILWNYAGRVLGRRSKVLDAIKIAALDNGFRRKPEEEQLPGFLNSLSEHERDLFARIRADAQYRLAIWQEIYDEMRGTPEEEALNLKDTLRHLKAPVTLIHGRDDDVIAASESVLMHHRLKEMGLPSRLCVTRLISHGDSSLGLAMVADALVLAGAFAYFFENVR